MSEGSIKVCWTPSEQEYSGDLVEKETGGINIAPQDDSREQNGTSSVSTYDRIRILNIWQL